jgi:hypothetical protein
MKYQGRLPGWREKEKRKNYSITALCSLNGFGRQAYYQQKKQIVNNIQ